MEVNNDPFHPAGNVMSFKTQSAAMEMPRPCFPDWILFRKGDVFTNQTFGSVSFWGRNRNEPMLIGAYGGSDDTDPC